MNALKHLHPKSSLGISVLLGLRTLLGRKIFTWIFGGIPDECPAGNLEEFFGFKDGAMTGWYRVVQAQGWWPVVKEFGSAEDVVRSVFTYQIFGFSHQSLAILENYGGLERFLSDVGMSMEDFLTVVGEVAGSRYRLACWAIRAFGTRMDRHYNADRLQVAGEYLHSDGWLGFLNDENDAPEFLRQWREVDALGHNFSLHQIRDMFPDREYRWNGDHVFQRDFPFVAAMSTI
jgi:hypothetical protein